MLLKILNPHNLRIFLLFIRLNCTIKKKEVNCAVKLVL